MLKATKPSIFKQLQMNLEFYEDEHKSDILKKYSKICKEHISNEEEKESPNNSALEWECVIWDLLHTLDINRIN